MQPRRRLVTSLSLFACLASLSCSDPYSARPSEEIDARPDEPAGRGPVPEASATVELSAAPPETAGGDETTQRTDGMPEMTAVTYFGVPGVGFPTYLAHLVGSKFRLFPSVEITNPGPVAQRVVLRGALQGYTKHEAIATIDLAPGETKKGAFTAALDFAALGRIAGPVSATFQISLATQEGRILNARSRDITLLPKNTVLWKDVFSGATPAGAAEKRAVVGAMTTPHDTRLRVDALLREAAAYSRFKAMIGYQYHRPTSTQGEDVGGADDQLGAIYAALEARGFNYTTVAEAFFAGAQNVRYPAEALEVASANCIDGALVFASALESLDMDPVIVFVPGHAFVGVHAAPAGTPHHGSVVFVETVLLGRSDYRTASLRAKETWQEHAAAKTALVIDVKATRKEGFLPSPFPL